MDRVSKQSGHAVGYAMDTLEMELSMNSNIELSKLKGASHFRIRPISPQPFVFSVVGSDSHIKLFSLFISSLAHLIPASIKKNPSKISGCLPRTALPQIVQLRCLPRPTMDAFGGNDEESAELKKLNAEVVSGTTAILRSSQCFC